MDRSPDYVSLALRLERQDFVVECPFPFLLAVNEPLPSEELPSEETIMAGAKDPAPPRMGPLMGRSIAYAVRKTNPLIPHSIIVGRADTSDIMILDRQISKTHALFQGAGDRWELSDAGSRNGTWVGHRKLAPRGDAAVVQSFDILSFGHRVYLFLDAGDCWDQIRAAAAAH